MKLMLNEAAPRGEAWKRKSRQPNTYPPPDDGREWILLEDAAKLFGIQPRSMMDKARKLDFTRTFRKSVKTWLLKSEIVSYLDFLKRRARWWKKYDPPHWRVEAGSFEGLTDAEMQRFMWTSEQAAAFMGVGTTTINRWARSGKIPVFYHRKMGKGGRHWYSPTSLRNYKEDEDRLKRKAISEKANVTLRTGVVGREVYKQRHKARVYKKPIPAGWLTIREAAELLHISLVAMHNLRKRGAIEAEHFTGKWDAKVRPWFILRSSLETYVESEHYQRKHREGVKIMQKRAGTYVSSEPENLSAFTVCPPREYPERADVYPQEELISRRERNGYIPNPDVW